MDPCNWRGNKGAGVVHRGVCVCVGGGVVASVSEGEAAAEGGVRFIGLASGHSHMVTHLSAPLGLATRCHIKAMQRHKSMRSVVEERRAVRGPSREVCGHLGGRQFACEAAADRPDGVGVATAGPNQVLPGPRECSPRKIRTESKD